MEIECKHGSYYRVADMVEEDGPTKAGSLPMIAEYLKVVCVCSFCGEIIDPSLHEESKHESRLDDLVQDGEATQD